MSQLWRKAWNFHQFTVYFIFGCGSKTFDGLKSFQFSAQYPLMFILLVWLNYYRVVRCCRGLYYNIGNRLRSVIANFSSVWINDVHNKIIMNNSVKSFHCICIRLVWDMTDFNCSDLLLKCGFFGGFVPHTKLLQWLWFVMFVRYFLRLLYDVTL